MPIRYCSETVFTDRVPGDLVETGGRGGAVILMRAILKAYGVQFVIISGCAIPSCYQAMQDYLEQNRIDDTLQWNDYTGSFWWKTDPQ